MKILRQEQSHYLISCYTKFGKTLKSWPPSGAHRKILNVGQEKWGSPLGGTGRLGISWFEVAQQYLENRDDPCFHQEPWTELQVLAAHHCDRNKIDLSSPWPLIKCVAALNLIQIFKDMNFWYHMASKCNPISSRGFSYEMVIFFPPYGIKNWPPWTY